MAICMARKMRSGTLVGPGTNKKLRPGFLAPAIQFLPWDFLVGPGSRPGFAWKRLVTSALPPCNSFPPLEQTGDAAVGGKLDIVGSRYLGQARHGHDVPADHHHE